MHSHRKSISVSLAGSGAVAYNCSTFTNKIADFMGMETVNHLLFPRNYIAALKDANSGVETLSGSVDTLG